ncbi:MAG TPA: hypothetical protein VHV09_19490 [Trebonia sp.]|nr:hypothetical protein [Trebonia sp.]
MHRVDDQAAAAHPRLAESGPAGAAVGGVEQRALADGPAVGGVGEVDLGQRGRAGVLTGPGPATVAGGQDPPGACHPAVGRVGELHRPQRGSR